MIQSKNIKKILLLCFLSVGKYTYCNESKLETILPKFEEYVQKTMQEWNVAGLAVVVVTPNKTLYLKGFGTREVSKNKPVDGHTVFQIASLTKVFTSALSGILEHQKVFSLNDPIKKYLPEFDLTNKEVAAKATLHDLISHRMGLGDFKGDTLMKIGYSPMDIVKKIATFPYEQKYREDYGYSNPFFGFMGLVMENATGKTYSELLDSNIFKPLKMADSSVGQVLIDQFNSIINKIKSLFGKDANIALGHDHDANGNLVSIGLGPILYLFDSTSGVNTSAYDIGAFLQCLLNKGLSQDGTQVLPEEFIQTMLTPLVHSRIKSYDMQFPIDVIRNVSYGTGLFGYEYGSDNKSLKIYGHMGGYVGQRVLFFMCPDESFAVCILSNTGHFNIGLLFPEVLRNKFFDLYLDLPDRDWNKEYLKKRSDFMQMRANQRMNKKILKPATKKNDEFYTGVYNNQLYGTLTISKDKGELKLSLNNKSCSMKHFNGNEFDLNASEFSQCFSRADTHFIEFFPTNDGRILAYVSFMDEGIEPFFEKQK